MPLRVGPCAAPGCPNPDDNAGQWKDTPQGFEGALAKGHNGCLCKRDRCRAHFGLPPLSTTGKKRAAAEACVAVGAAVSQGPPRPFRLRGIDQIWGVRWTQRPPARPPCTALTGDRAPRAQECQPGRDVGG